MSNTSFYHPRPIGFPLLAAALAAYVAGCSGVEPTPEELALKGRVIGVPEGDTVIIRTDAGTDVTARLYGIDAPDPDQPFGAKATEFLSRYARGREVEISPVRSEGSTVVARLNCEGKDLSALMVENGWAWVAPDSQDKELLELEEQARKWRVSMWIQRNLEPPWRYKAARRAESGRLEHRRAAAAAERPQRSAGDTPQCRQTRQKAEAARAIFSDCLRKAKGAADCSQEQADYWAVEKQLRGCP